MSEIFPVCFLFWTAVRVRDSFLPTKSIFCWQSWVSAGLRDAIREKLDSLQREQFMQAEKRYQLKYPPVSLDGRINLLKAVLQRDLSTEVNVLLSDLFETHVGSEKETARRYYLNL